MTTQPLEVPALKTDWLIHALGTFFVLSLVGNDESLFFQFGQFSIAPFDIAFWVMVGLAIPRLSITGLRANSPKHLHLIVLLLVGMCWVIGSLLVSSSPFGDRLRDFRLIIYFLLPPLLVGQFLSLERDGVVLLKYSVLGGLLVSAIVYNTAATQSGIGGLGRNIRVGVWIIPVSLLVLAYFRRELGLSTPAMTAMTVFMFSALVLSQNRSQYIQFVASFFMLLLLSKQKQSLLVYAGALGAGGVTFLFALGRTDAGQIVIDRMMTFLYLYDDNSLGSRAIESEGQLEEFYLSPIVGNGIGYRMYSMGPNGFELSTFAHNSWLFYLAKFGIVGTILVLSAPIVAQLLLLLVRLEDAQMEKYRVFLLACFPVYFYIDAMSAGLAYAPKTPITGFFVLFICGVLAKDYQQNFKGSLT